METNYSPKKLPRLEDLKELTIHELRQIYEQVLQRPAPSTSSHDIIRGNIAWAVQAIQHGKDPHKLREQMVKLAKNHLKKKATLPYQVGTRLVREWQGETHEVTILDNGFRWRGTVYQSLTRIATEITGTKWSGPRFFGLKEKNNEMKS